MIGRRILTVATAAMLARSLHNLDRAELGLDPHNVLTFKVDATLNGYGPERVRALSNQILEGLRASPGVVGAVR